MKVVRPIPVDDAMLFSSSASETDYPAWTAGAYTAGDRCIRTTTHRIYERVVTGSSTIPPEDDCSGTLPNWLDVGPTNRWAMFDTKVSTATSFSLSGTVVLKPVGFVNAISLINVLASTVHVSMIYGGETVFDQTYDMDGSVITDFYTYLFEPFQLKDNLLITDLPPYLSPTITVTLSGLSIVSCGVCVVGRSREIGGLKRGSGFSIIDYSTKDIDTYGTVTFVRRGNSDELNCLLQIDDSLVASFRQSLKGLTATPCVWIGTDKVGREYMSAYGWFGDFTVVIQYDTFSTCNLTVKSLI